MQVEEEEAPESRSTDEQLSEQKKEEKLPDEELPEDEPLECTEQPESIEQLESTEQSVIQIEQTEKEKQDLEAAPNEILIITNEQKTSEQPSPPASENSIEQQILKEADSSIDDLDPNLVNELICKEPSLGDFNEEDEELAKLGVRRIKEERKPVKQSDENNLNEDNLNDKAECTADQPLVIDENLSKADLSENNLIECIPEKSNEADALVRTAESITDGGSAPVDTDGQESVIQESANESANDPDEPANQESKKPDESDKPEASSSGEQSNDKPVDRSKDSSAQSSGESNRTPDGIDQSDAAKPVDRQETGANKTADQRVGLKLIKVKEGKAISKQHAKGKRKVKIKQSNNLADKLFKRACKYNLNLLEPKYWSSEDVSVYLKQIGFESEAQCFKEKSVDGKSLLKLSRQDVLSNFGIKLGKAVKIYAYLNDLQIRNKCNILFE